MNIEIANRLYQYRKKSGFSQEELAEQIGVSRQAVSKWERAEASPDTDNLIELSKIYGVSLDEMINGSDEEQPQAEAHEQTAQSSTSESDNGFTVNSDGDRVNISHRGIHVHDHNGTHVDIDRNGIFVTENGEQKVFTDEDGHIHKSADVIAQEKKNSHPFLKFPYPIVAVIAYLLFGYFNVMGGWGYGWIVFLTIPLYYTLVEAILKRDANIFCYPVLAVIAFLLLGFVFNLWHPGWVVFLTVPLYYGIVKLFRQKKE